MDFEHDRILNCQSLNVPNEGGDVVLLEDLVGNVFVLLLKFAHVDEVIFSSNVAQTRSWTALLVRVTPMCYIIVCYNFHSIGSYINLILHIVSLNIKGSNCIYKWSVDRSFCLEADDMFARFCQEFLWLFCKLLQTGGIRVRVPFKKKTYLKDGSGVKGRRVKYVPKLVHFVWNSGS